MSRLTAVEHPSSMRVLAISGSLRSESTNTSVLRSLMVLAPAGLEIMLYDGLSEMPAFNPDLEANGNGNFEAVTRFSDAVAKSDAVVFSTPEYAHGIPGALKNALDWIVGSGELSEKPVAMVNASSRALYAQAALKEVLFAMNARLLPNAEATIDLPRRDMSPAEIAEENEFGVALRKCLEVVTEAVRARSEADKRNAQQP